jgi:hypothetical protein
VIGLFPRQDDLAPVIARVNKDLSAIADGDHVSFLDAGANLTPDEFQDGFHLTVAAYRKWAGQIGTALERLHTLSASPADPSDR